MDKCPVFKIARVVGKKWTIGLLQEVDLNGNKGFNAISKRMKTISPKILSVRLKELEASGIITKKLVGVKSIQSKYKLTKKGKGLQKIMKNLKDWNAEYSAFDNDCNNKKCVECKLYY